MSRYSHSEASRAPRVPAHDIIEAPSPVEERSAECVERFDTGRPRAAYQTGVSYATMPGLRSRTVTNQDS